jgi:hypothetical protein
LPGALPLEPLLQPPRKLLITPWNCLYLTDTCAFSLSLPDLCDS